MFGILLIVVVEIFINQAKTVHTRICGAAIKILKIPITAPSVPSFMYFESIANGSAKMLAQPIPASPIAATVEIVFGKNVSKMYANAISKRHTKCTFLLP